MTNPRLISALFSLSFLVGCKVPLTDAPCPCAVGWVCCGDRDVCVAPGQACPSEGPDLSGVDLSGADLSRPPSDAQDDQVSISGFLPMESVKAGQQLLVFGQNFDFSIGATGLYFDGASVLSFEAGSSDTLLIVTVPFLSGLPAAGQQVSVTVYNEHTSASKTITVFPADNPILGLLNVTAGTAGVAQPGQSVDFAFALTSGANQAASFTLSSELDTGWPVQFLAQDDQTAIDAIQLTPNAAATTIHARVAVPASANTGTAFDLSVRVSNGGNVFGSTGPIRHMVGQADAASDPDISLTQPTANPPSLLLDGDTLAVPGGSVVLVTVPISFTSVGGDYDFSFGPAADSGPLNGWLVNFSEPSFGQLPGASVQITFEPNTTEDVVLAVEPPQGTPASGILELTVQKVGASVGVSRRFSVFSY